MIESRRCPCCRTRPGLPTDPATGHLLGTCTACRTAACEAWRRGANPYECRVALADHYQRLLDQPPSRTR